MNKDEMIKDIPSNIIAYDGNPKGQHLYIEQRKEIAEALYNANYRKIADDEIVIKKSEYETLKAQNDTLELYNKDLKYTNKQLANANKLFAKRNDELLDELQECMDIKAKTKQETAREILFTIYTYLKGAMTQQTTALMIVKALAEHYGIELGEVEK